MGKSQHDPARPSGESRVDGARRLVIPRAGAAIRDFPRADARIYRRIRAGEQLRLADLVEGFAEIDLGLAGRGFIAVEDIEAIVERVEPSRPRNAAERAERLRPPLPRAVDAVDANVLAAAPPSGPDDVPRASGAAERDAAGPREQSGATATDAVERDRSGFGGAIADAVHVDIGSLRRAYSTIASWRASAYAEAISACGVMAVLLAVRLDKLGTVPRVVTADETDNLQNAYHIIAGTGPGFFGFDWKPAPIFSLYPLAWSIQAFGNSIADFRMFPVILSLLTLVAFYAVARDVMRPAAAIPAMLLLGANLWFLHFSRTAWENMNSALFALGAILALTRAIRTERVLWWACTGVFIAFGLYGYFTGRFIFISVGLATLIAIATRLTPWRAALRGLAVAAVVAAVLFAPMAKHIYDNWDRFNSRTSDISVFHNPQPYEGDTNGWVIAAKNVVRNTRGFILQDGGEFSRGLWARYNPDRRPPLDAWMAPLLWIGLIVGAVRWRKTYMWWTLFVPFYIAEVFSKGTPDAARGLIIAPVLFLFIGLVFEEVLKRRRTALSLGAAFAVIAVIAVYSSVTNVRDYFNWQETAAAQSARLPGADGCEFAAWRQLAVAAANAGPTNLDPAKFDAARKRLECSTVARASLEEKAQGAQPTPPPTPALRDERRRHDLDALHLALIAYAKQEGTYPVTQNVQSLCVYKADDVGCKLTKVLDVLPQDPSGRGYWYRSDGNTFILYAQLETEAGGCTNLPAGFFQNPKMIYCVTDRRP